MIKRFFDIIISLVAIILTAPILVIAAGGILLTSKGPVFYRAQRIGLNGRVFTMHKFRTMHWQVQGAAGAVITAANDTRIFPFGQFLRKTKIDELPQFIDVIRGVISIVGPRPEDPKIVEQYYTSWMKETLMIKPGITSPGALWGYTKMERLLQDSDPEKAYVEKVLPYKLALEYVYTKRHNLKYDLSLMWRTALTIVQICLGKQDFPDQPEDAAIHELLPELSKEQAA